MTAVVGNAVIVFVVILLYEYSVNNNYYHCQYGCNYFTFISIISLHCDSHHHYLPPRISIMIIAVTMVIIITMISMNSILIMMTMIIVIASSWPS